MMRCLHDVRTGGTRGEGGAFPRGDKGSSHTFSFVFCLNIDYSETSLLPENSDAYSYPPILPSTGCHLYLHSVSPAV